MEFKIKWTPAANKDVQSINNFIAQHDVDAADRQVAAIAGSVEALMTFPRIGVVYRDLPTGEVREIQSGNYRVFYKIFEATLVVQIVRVQHVRRRDPTF